MGTCPLRALIGFVIKTPMEANSVRNQTQSLFKQFNEAVSEEICEKRLLYLARVQENLVHYRSTHVPQLYKVKTTVAFCKDDEVLLRDSTKNAYKTKNLGSKSLKPFTITWMGEFDVCCIENEHG